MVGLREGLFALLGLLFFAVAAVPGLPALADDKPYQIVDGKVDKATFNGFRRFMDYCARCHGQYAVGSSFAPSLVESLTHLSYEDFTNVVINGRQNTTAGQEKVMPAFGYVEDVASYIDDIYAYLKARSDGAIGVGRPKRVGE